MVTTVQPAAQVDADAVLPATLIIEHARISVDTTLTPVLARTACRWVERRTRLALTRRAWTATFDGFADTLFLPVGPIASVDAISYLDGTGASQPLLPAAWRQTGADIAAAAGTYWPRALCGAGTVTIQFTAGFADVANDAPDLVTAALMMFAHLWRNREGDTDQVLAVPPPLVALICDEYRLPVIAS